MYSDYLMATCFDSKKAFKVEQS